MVSSKKKPKSLCKSHPTSTTASGNGRAESDTAETRSKSDTKPRWEGLGTQQDPLSAPEEQQTPPGALRGHDPHGLGRTKLYVNPPLAQGASGEGLCHAREQPGCAQHPPAAGRRGQIPGFITGNTDDALGGAILPASQKQEVTVAHGGLGKVCLAA